MKSEKLNPLSRWNVMEHVGRVLLASLFILGGVNKLLNWSSTAERMANSGLEPAQLLLVMTVALELGGGLWLAWGRRHAWLPGIALALFTITTNLVFHRFWEMLAPIQALELSLFFKNIAIAGALIMASARLAMRRE